jgi:hypothetical protein
VLSRRIGREDRGSRRGLLGVHMIGISDTRSADSRRRRLQSAHLVCDSNSDSLCRSAEVTNDRWVSGLSVLAVRDRAARFALLAADTLFVLATTLSFGLRVEHLEIATAVPEEQLVVLLLPRDESLQRE